MGSTTTTSIKLDDTLKARLQQLALAQRRSVHWLMREAIADYVARQEQAAGAAVRDAPSQTQTPRRQTPSQASPPAPPSEDAYAWLARLEARGVGVKPPKRRP